MAGYGKKGSMFTPDEARRLLDQLSKAALMDIAWNLAAIGTDESHEQVLARLAKEAVITCAQRGDRLPKELDALGSGPIV